MNPNRIGAKTAEEIAQLLELSMNGKTFAEVQPTVSAALIASLDPVEYPQKHEMMQRLRDTPSVVDGMTHGEIYDLEFTAYEKIAADIHIKNNLDQQCPSLSSTTYNSHGF